MLHTVFLSHSNSANDEIKLWIGYNKLSNFAEAYGFFWGYHARVRTGCESSGFFSSSFSIISVSFSSSCSQCLSWLIISSRSSGKSHMICSLCFLVSPRICCLWTINSSRLFYNKVSNLTRGVINIIRQYTPLPSSQRIHLTHVK